MAEPSDNPEAPATQRPFHYSLRSLFVITTVLAVWLGLWRISPQLGLSVIAVPLLSVFALPFVFETRRRFRSGEHKMAIACLATGLFLAVPPIAVSGLIDVPGLEQMAGKPDVVIWAMLGPPILVYPIWVGVCAARGEL